MGFIGIVDSPSRHSPRKQKHNVTLGQLLDKIDGLHELCELVEKIDCTRARQRKYVSAIELLLDDEPALQDVWHEFQRTDGVTVQDFEKFVTAFYRGKVTARAVTRREHLRLVISRSPETDDTHTPMSR